MEARNLLLLLLLLAVAAFVATGDAHSKFRHLHLYSHNADPAVSVDLHRNNSFGNILVFDNLLREGPDPSSPAIARPQGMAVISDLTGAKAFTAYTITFIAGEFNGSSLSVLGLTTTTEVSDRSIVGGTGCFRTARGYVLSQYVNNNARLEEYNVYITFS
ncbi:dirigent protein 1-like [Curcuma longa]|uniref:dirigent protein 1-like n=1 Tax=Curcuma longa TaxID=136217 RepID=UPI003D9EE985